MSGIIIALRWLFMPIACILSAVIVSTFLTSINAIGIVPGTFEHTFYLPIIRGFALGFGWVAAAYLVSPSNKAVASSIMGTLLPVGMLAFFGILALQFELPTEDKIIQVIVFVTCIIGEVVGYRMARSEDSTPTQAD